MFQFSWGTTGIAEKFYTTKTAESIVDSHKLLNHLLFQIFVTQGTGELVLEQMGRVVGREEFESELKRAWSDNQFLPSSFVTQTTFDIVLSPLRERTRTQLVKDVCEEYREHQRGPDAESTYTLKDFFTKTSLFSSDRS